MADCCVPEPVTVPATLRAKDYWVCWQAPTDDTARRATLPVHPVDPETGHRISTNDEPTLVGFDAARATATTEAAVDGIAFYPTAEDPFTEVLLSGCRDPETGVLDDWAQTIITTLYSYTEQTCRPDSIRVLVAGQSSTWTTGPLSVRDRQCFVPVTGATLPMTPASINERVVPLRAVCKAWELADEPPAAATMLSEADIEAFGGLPAQPVVDVELSDDQLLERAHDGPTGALFSTLWHGEETAYLTRAEADLALCCHLAYWTGGDGEWMARLYRKSERYRGKWTTIPPGDDRLYAERTIERALALTDTYYSPAPSGSQDQPTL